MEQLKEFKNNEVGMANQETKEDLSLLASVTLKLWTIIAAILSVTYLVELIKGEYSPLFYIGFYLLAWGPIILGYTLKKQGRNEIVKRIMSFGYGFLCLYIAYFNTNNNMVLLYMLPILMITSIWQDVGYTTRVGVLASIATVLWYVRYHFTVGLDTIMLEKAKIGVAIIVVMAFFTEVSSKTLLTISKRKLSSIEKEQENQQNILNNIISSTAVITDQIDGIKQASVDVENQSSDINTSMDEITKGASETATTLQQQMEMTSNIEEIVVETSDMSARMRDNFEDTITQANNGMKDMQELNSSSKVLEESNQQVVTAMNNLNSKMDDARSIIELINSITNQTTLLALNASIEAARAGEMGKGFAVVANEIQKLAQNTSEATNSISSLLEELDQESKNTISAIEKLGEITTQQGTLISTTNERFVEIESSLNDFSKEIISQVDQLAKIKESTAMLNTGIEGVSSFSEELMANTDTTKSISEKSLDRIKNMALMIDDVLNETEKLRALV